MTYLVDTDWVVDYLKGRLRAIALVDQLLPDGVGISAVTYGEIWEGLAPLGEARRAEEEALWRFTRAFRVYPVDRPVARRFGLIRRFLREAGLLITDTDILIAATAVEHRLVLVTRNLRHFQRVPDLILFEAPEPLA